MRRQLKLNDDKKLEVVGEIEMRELKRYALGTWVEKEEVFSSNLSAELTILIQNAGRWCERFASDVLHNIDFANKFLAEAYDNYADEEVGFVTGKSFLFGFRRDGVDHDSFIESNYGRSNYYRAIYELYFEVRRPDERHLEIWYGFDRLD